MSPCKAAPDDPLFKGVCIVGNGRSVLSHSAGPAVDRFGTVLRFNDFQIAEFEAHVRHLTRSQCSVQPPRPPHLASFLESQAAQWPKPPRGGAGGRQDVDLGCE